MAVDEVFASQSDGETETIDEQAGKFLTFPLQDSLYGIEIQHVLEVVICSTTSKITQVPHMPSYTRGVINLRGKVIPVIDLRSRFKLELTEYNDRTCYVVVNIRGVTTGLIVDTVSGVVGIPPADVDPAPELENNMDNRFIAGLGKTEEDVYILLNIQELLQKQELEALKQSF